MSSYSIQQQVSDLLNEVAGAAADLQRSVTAEILAAVEKAKGALSAPATSNSHLSLVLSAARRHTQDIEKRVVALIIGDERIYQREMSQLVRIRLLCAKLLNLFARALADLKLQPQGRHQRRPGTSGA
jgi:hypothetical protein